MKSKPWERLPDESGAAFAAFKCYLELDERNIQKVSTELSKSRQLITRWASEYDWKERAIAYDNSLLEDVRRDIRRMISREIKRQWQDSIEFQKLSAAALKKKDMSKGSFKSLNEIYHSARAAQWELYDRLKLDENDDEIKIIIEDAGGDADERCHES